MTEKTALPETPLNLIVALPAEARPLIDAFSLRADDSARGLRLFRQGAVRLAVVGIGKTAAATGVGYLAASAPEAMAGKPTVWLNVGIAGHGTMAVGEVTLANAVRDRASGQSWYPPLVVEPPAPTSVVTTVDQPETVYGEDTAYDMEAAGFMAAARRFSSAELVHCLKVISDGKNGGIESITRQKVEQWMSATIEVIRDLATRLSPLAAELASLEAPSPLEDELCQRWHFTFSDRQALRRELRRLNVLRLDFTLPDELWQGVRRGRDAVSRLQAWLDQVALGTLQGSPEEPR